MILTSVYVQSIDSYMNIQLSNTEEFIDRKFTGALGQVLIRYVYVCLTTTTVSSPSRCVFAADRWQRCNNVLYVTAADKGEGDRDTKMEG